MWIKEHLLALKMSRLWRWWFGWIVGESALSTCGSAGLLGLVLISARCRWAAGEVGFADLKEKTLEWCGCPEFWEVKLQHRWENKF